MCLRFRVSQRSNISRALLAGKKNDFFRSAGFVTGHFFTYPQNCVGLVGYTIHSCHPPTQLQSLLHPYLNSASPKTCEEAITLKTFRIKYIHTPHICSILLEKIIVEANRKKGIWFSICFIALFRYMQYRLHISMVKLPAIDRGGISLHSNRISLPEQKKPMHHVAVLLQAFNETD